MIFLTNSNLSINSANKAQNVTKSSNRICRWICLICTMASDPFECDLMSKHWASSPCSWWEAKWFALSLPFGHKVVAMGAQSHPWWAKTTDATINTWAGDMQISPLILMPERSLRLTSVALSRRYPAMSSIVWRCLAMSGDVQNDFDALKTERMLTSAGIAWSLRYPTMSGKWPWKGGVSWCCLVLGVGDCLDPPKGCWNAQDRV
mgnify:CR=1 FL=1